MRYRAIAMLASCFGLLLQAASSFTRNNTLLFHRPAVGGEFRFSLKYQKKAEALLIALSAAPHLFEGYDFGLGEAVGSMSEADCTDQSDMNLDSALRDRIEARYAWAQLQFIDSAPPWPLSRHAKTPGSNAVFPSNVFGRLYLLFRNYPALSSGNGILHYMRCDYSLHLEPY